MFQSTILQFFVVTGNAGGASPPLQPLSDRNCLAVRDDRGSEGRTKLAGEVVEDAAGAAEIGEEFFFGAEFAGMGYEATAGAACGVFDVEHFVIEDVFDGNLRDGG